MQFMHFVKPLEKYEIQNMTFYKTKYFSLRLCEEVWLESFKMLYDNLSPKD